MSDTNGRITVSEDKLYRALAEQELRILEGVEKKLTPFNERVTRLELTDASTKTLAAEMSRRADRRAMLKPTLMATTISTIAAAVLHFF